MIRILDISCPSDGSFSEADISARMFTYSGGEEHIRITDSNIKDQDVVIEFMSSSYKSSGMIIRTLLANDALRRLAPKSVSLMMPYLPYARQDRVCAEGDSFSLKVFADLINSCKFDNVYVLDPHSDVSGALINNIVEINWHGYALSVYRQIKKRQGMTPYLIAPDAGSSKKVHALAKFIFDITGDKPIVVQGGKLRDPTTGELSGFSVDYDNLATLPCLVVDDICDGGGTFIGLAKELKKKRAGLLYLYVTHGIFSKGLEKLYESYDDIFCTNSFSTMNRNFKEKKLTLFQIKSEEIYG